MVYVWMLSSFVLYTKMTESDEKPEIDLERCSQCYYDIGDEMLKIINSDEFKTGIDRFKAYYLTNSGYYVPNELRNDEDMLRMNLGDYEHDMEAPDRECYINEESMDKFAETLNTLTGIVETISLEDWDAAAIGLIFSGVNFYLSNTFHLLRLFVLFDKCDGSEKDKESNPSFYTVGDEQLQVLNLIRGEIECRLIEWQDDVKKSRDEIGKLAEKHKKNLNNKERSQSKSQSIQFEELKKYYTQIEDYHKKMKAVFECIFFLNEQNVDKNFCLGLTKYFANLGNYCSHFAKIFAKRTKELVKPLDKGLDADTRNNLGSLKQAVTSVSKFVNFGTYEGSKHYKTLVSHHNRANPDEKIEISHFGQLRYDTVKELENALQLIESVPKEELPEFDRPLILTCKRLTIMLGGAILSCGTASYLWFIRN